MIATSTNQQVILDNTYLICFFYKKGDMRPYINNVYPVERSVTVFKVLTSSYGDSKLELHKVEFSKINKEL